MSNTATNVVTGKPKVGGAVFSAPTGTTLPTDTTTALDNAFKCLGYISDAGVTNGMTRESESIKAWGGDTVMTTQTSFEDKWTFTPIEGANIDVLKNVYGDSNVTGALSTGITVNANSTEPVAKAWVFEMVIGTYVKRVVLPSAKLSELGDIVYVDNAAVGYEMTLTAFPDSSGNNHYEYIK